MTLPAGENVGKQSNSHRRVEWIYQGLWKGLVKWFRVPEGPPELPISNDQRFVQSFRPSNGFLKYLKIQFWVALFAMDIFFIGAWIAIAIAFPIVGVLITPLALAIIILPDVIAYIAIHLKYDSTWYVMTDRSLRIRRGIWTIHETTLTYENIQNVKVVQGPLERYFGIANVIVETAGGGGGADAAHGGQGTHVGRIEGVDNAPQLREWIMSRTASSSSTGLGNHEDELQPHASLAWTPEQIQVLREIADLFPKHKFPKSKSLTET